MPTTPFDTASHASPAVASNRIHDDGGRTYLLLLDDLHTHPLRSDMVVAIARHFIEHNLLANDLVALATTTGQT